MDTETLLQNLPEFIIDWNKHMTISNISESSRNKYIREIKGLLTYINDDISSITPKDITLQTCDSYLIASSIKRNKDGTLSENSEKYLKSLSSAIRKLVQFIYDKHYIETDFSSEIKRPNGAVSNTSKRNNILTKNDFKNIFKEAEKGDGFKNKTFHNRNVAIVSLFLTTGLRRTSISSLNIDDLSENILIANVRNKRKEYYLSGITLEYMNKWVKDREQLNISKDERALFINKELKRLSKQGVDNVIRLYCEKATGKKISPNDFKMSFCSILYKKTHDIEIVRQTVGDSDISTTQKYIRGNDKIKKATKIMDNVLKD